MSMPVAVEITDLGAPQASLDKAFDYFRFVDNTFSTYKKNSEISRINRAEATPAAYSDDMRSIFELAEQTKRETRGYFDIQTPNGQIDPSGIVKGWAINNVAELLRSLGHENFYVEAGGDIQTSGKNADDEEWRIGIRNPFDREEIVKVVYPRGKGIATSGTAVRGEHIYDPHTGKAVATNVVSLTVIGPNVYEADRFATAAFAMADAGIRFIEALDGFEGYAIDKNGVATMTTGFTDYTYDQGD
jgi:thiamine biosynthesis lipoprotein